MTTFDQKFIEDSQFLKWIFNSNPILDKYWEQYILDHPEEEPKILELKKQLSKLSFFNESLNFTEKENLKMQVISRIDQDFRKHKRKSMIQSYLKYAAVAIVFAVIGGLLVYLNSPKESVYEKLASQMIQMPQSNGGPILTTSNGQNVELKKSNSSVDYTHNGTIVLNNDSVLQTADVPNSLNQLVVPYGNQSKVVLADNTVVWLNAGSRLIYPTYFRDKTREVMLFGEAFFEVSKNPNQPFIVKTSAVEIKVLGTQFNISAYPEDNVIQTVLKEGSVSIHRINAALFESELVLKPNQMAYYDKNSTDTKVYTVDVSDYTLWTKGLLNFDDTELNRIIKKIERFYNIRVSYSNPNLGAIRISGKLNLRQNREEVLEYIMEVSSVRIEKVADNQYIVRK